MGVLTKMIWKDEYKYYDSPEGQDCLKKIMYVTKYSGIYAFFGASIDILTYSHPKGYGGILGRYAYIVFPVMGMGAAFATATCAATNIRNKDDPWNYAIGSLAATTVWGAWQRSFRIGIYGGLLCAIAAGVCKDVLENDYNVFTHKQAPNRLAPWNKTFDLSLTKDPGRTWKTSANE